MVTYIEAYNEIFHQKLESIEWKKQGPDLRYAASLSVFKKNFLKFINSSPNKVFFFATAAKESNISQDYAVV